MKNQTFGEEIKWLRERKGCTQKEFAVAVGLSPNTICNYEKGLRTPSYTDFGKIADALGVSYDYLLGKSDSKHRENIAISAQLGLSDEAITKIRQLKKASNKKTVTTNLKKPKYKQTKYEQEFITVTDALNLLFQSDVIHRLVLLTIQYVNDMMLYEIDLTMEKRDTEALGTIRAEDIGKYLKEHLNEIGEGKIADVTAKLEAGFDLRKVVDTEEQSFEDRQKERAKYEKEQFTEKLNYENWRTSNKILNFLKEEIVKFVEEKKDAIINDYCDRIDAVSNALRELDEEEAETLQKSLPFEIDEKMIAMYENRQKYMKQYRMEKENQMGTLWADIMREEE